MNDNYVENLKKVIKEMNNSLEDIPLNLVIESLTNHKIIPFNPNEIEDKSLLSDLINIANFAVLKINKKGISKSRPNEVGNAIESFVKESLMHYGYDAYTPNTKDGSKKASGYPDIEFIDKYERINYLECKTYNEETIDSTLRSFYLSPSKNSKITKDAHHFIISFEIYNSSSIGKSNIYKCNNWKILSIDKLLVNIKYEFNSNNPRLYSKEMVIAET